MFQFNMFQSSKNYEMFHIFKFDTIMLTDIIPIQELDWIESYLYNLTSKTESHVRILITNFYLKNQSKPNYKHPYLNYLKLIL